MLSSPNVCADSETTLLQSELLEAQNLVKNVKCDETIDIKVVELSRHLRNQGVTRSDRTYKQGRVILQAEAWLNGHDSVMEEDLEVLKNVLWHDPDESRKTESIILEIINPEKNKVIELYDASMKLLHDFHAKKPGVEKEESCIELISKVRKAKDDIMAISESLKKGKRSTTTIEPYLEKLNTILKELWVKQIGQVTLK